MDKNTAGQNNLSRGPIFMAVLTSFFTALIAVGGFIRIPLQPIPITLQTMLVMTAGLILGKKYGAISTALFALLGIIGLPIFTFGGGLGSLLQPTFGYIIGFIPTAFVIGGIARGDNNRPSFVRLMSACIVGMGVIYFFGVVYWYILGNFVINSPIAVKTVLLSGMIACLPGDIIKAIFAAALSKRIISILSKQAIA